MENKKIIEPECIIYNGNQIITYNKHSNLPNYIKYRSNLYDQKLRINYDKGLIINFKKIPEDIKFIMFYSLIPNLEELNVNQFQDILYSGYYYLKNINYFFY